MAMANKKNGGHKEQPDSLFTEEELKNMVYDVRKDPSRLSSQVSVQVDENGRNHLVVDLGYLTAIDGNVLQDFQETFQKQRKEILDRISAEPPEEVHKDFLADHGEEDNCLDLAVYWYRDCSVQFELHNYPGALDWIIPAEELDRIQVPLADKIDSHRSDFPDRDLTLADLLTTWTPDGGSRESLLDQILKEIGQADLVPVESINLITPGSHYTPLDKFFKDFWWMTPESMAGQKLFTKATKKGQIDYSVTLNPDQLKEDGITISKPLTHFGKRLYKICDDSIEAGNMYTTASALYHDMGEPSKTAGCTKTYRDKILKELKVQRQTDIDIDNTKEAEQNPGYDVYKYSGPLLPNEYIEKPATVKGGTAEGYIHFLRDHLPLTEFSRGHNHQGKTFPANVYQTPNRLGDRQIAIEDYLLERIAGADSGATPPDILLDSIYEEAELPENAARTVKARCQKYAEKALDFWKDPAGCQIIAGYDHFYKGDKYVERVPVKDKNGKPKRDRDGNLIMEEKIKTHRGPGIHLNLLKEEAVEDGQKDQKALPDKGTATDQGK